MRRDGLHPLRQLLDAAVAGAVVVALARLVTSPIVIGPDATATGTLSAGSVPPACWAVLAGGTYLAARLAQSLPQGGRPSPRDWFRRAAGDGGTATVSFLLVFPIFLFVVSLIVQASLLAHASTVVAYASFVTARSAVVCLPDQKAGLLQQAAHVALEPISPAGSGASSSEATTALAGMNAWGAKPDSKYVARYAFAVAATTVTTSPTSMGTSDSPTDVTITLTYKFMLTAPFAARVLQPTVITLGGVTGRFLPLKAVCTVRTSPGREMPALPYGV